MHGYGREKGEENTESKKKVFEVLIRHNRDCFVENRSKNKNGIQNLEKIGKNLENHTNSQFSWIKKSSKIPRILETPEKKTEMTLIMKFWPKRK